MPTALEERPANPLYVGVAAFRQKHDVQVRLGVENRRKNPLDLVEYFSLVAARRHQPEDNVQAAAVAEIGMRQIGAPHQAVVQERRRQLLLQGALVRADLLAYEAGIYLPRSINRRASVESSLMSKICAIL